MSELRPTLKPSTSRKPSAKGGTAYLMILNAVDGQDGLIHGELHSGDRHCAIGSYFAVNHDVPLEWDLIDEVAAMNDSMPHKTPRQRKLAVMRWLKWKLGQAGMPGFLAKKL